MPWNDGLGSWRAARKRTLATPASSRRPRPVLRSCSAMRMLQPCAHVPSLPSRTVSAGCDNGGDAVPRLVQPGGPADLRSAGQPRAPSALSPPAARAEAGPAAGGNPARHAARTVAAGPEGGGDPGDGAQAERAVRGDGHRSVGPTPAQESAALARATATYGQPVPPAIVADGAGPAQVEITAMSDSTMTSGVIRVYVR
ncbi:hypothetical protein GDI2300 [Gluconacetobacter diazotrophicus PA1 5]|uniref:Uncharacterized protein n=1 Tax=Gluconacetobacter diazotrophicus (strain ATCC 49037 / DSM 5601 / CCUG 37298 / CIP 103539 / LMG 7603 / PAl5) TaxID=272568 RepID=A9HM27_GLUDA|nr:hypothetical protein GDI2300 [Gluconacetobacter diazotrophicus PA1 5]